MALASYMNNNRLSSKVLPAKAGEAKTIIFDSTQPKLQLLTECKDGSTEENYNLLVEKVRKLLSKPSNFEAYPDGKIFIKSEKKFWKGRGNVKIEVYNKEGLLLYSFENLEMTANFFNVSKHIIKYRLNSGMPLILQTEKLPQVSVETLRCAAKEVYFKRAIVL